MKLDAEIAFELDVQLRDGDAHFDRSAHGAQRVVLVQPRHSERGHHGVADELLDRTAVRSDHVAHRLEPARHHAPQRLRIELLAEARRSGDVRKQHGHRLARRGRSRRRARQRGPAGEAEVR